MRRENRPGGAGLGRGPTGGSVSALGWRAPLIPSTDEPAGEDDDEVGEEEVSEKALEHHGVLPAADWQEAHEVTVDSIIVNHVMEACDYDHCRRAASQKGYIEEIRAKFGEKQIALLPSYGEEVKGEGLAQVARDLYEKGQL